MTGRLTEVQVWTEKEKEEEVEDRLLVMGQFNRSIHRWLPSLLSRLGYISTFFYLQQVVFSSSG